MELIKWNKDFSVGIEKIDKQHIKIINLINNLYSAMSSGKGQTVVGETIDDLFDYADYHFKLEEELFRKYKYPNDVVHKGGHDYFVNTIKDFKRDYDGDASFLTFEVQRFLEGWLIDHICVSDMAYAKYFKDNNINIKI